MARFVAVVCKDLLSKSEGELPRLDHLDSNGRVRVVLPAHLRDSFMQSAADLRIELERVVMVEESSTRELDEPYLTFSTERTEWGLWFKCLAREKRGDKPSSADGWSESFWVTNEGISFHYCYSNVS
ncbi:MAG: hypothetical protein M5U25_01665 [Planctomycetota bacterium]|nr:hypothetical protein [Planctomycetota bacterium]